MSSKSGYYTEEELINLGLKKTGANVKISRRANLYNLDQMEFGHDVRIDDFCVLSGKLVFGNNIHITPYCLLAGADEGIYLEDFTTVAYRCSIFTRSDDYTGGTLVNSTIPEKYRYNTIKKAVYIKRHAIIGANSVVFPGADIGAGTSVGAMSLVLKPTEDWSIYVGSPARKLKDRKKDLLAQEKEYLGGLEFS